MIFLSKRIFSISVLVFYTIFLIPAVSHAQGSVGKTTKRLYLSVSGSAILVRENSSERLLVNNYLSSNILEIDGDVVHIQNYSPFGDTTDGSISSDKQFTSHRKLENLSIYHAGARFYSPTAGTFILPDMKEGPNRYAYVGNNPVSFIDKDGNNATSAVIDRIKRLMIDAIDSALTHGSQGKRNVLGIDSLSGRVDLHPQAINAHVLSADQMHPSIQKLQGIFYQNLRVFEEDIDSGVMSLHEAISSGNIAEQDRHLFLKALETVHANSGAKYSAQLHGSKVPGAMGVWKTIDMFRDTHIFNPEKMDNADQLDLNCRRIGVCRNWSPLVSRFINATMGEGTSVAAGFRGSYVSHSPVIGRLQGGEMYGLEIFRHVSVDALEHSSLFQAANGLEYLRVFPGKVDLPVGIQMGENFSLRRMDEPSRGSHDYRYFYSPE